jgi:DNA-binding response OmpR family regulator
MPAILLVEDDPTIGELVMSALRGDGHNVAWVRTGAEASRVASRRAHDLVLLDLGLPDVDGIELCRTLRRAQSEAVLMMLTARREEMDVIVGLEAGADDYLTKPFAVGVLLARVRAHLRRASQTNGQPSSYSCGDLTIDVSMRRCLLGSHEVVLRSKEFDLLSKLVSSAGQALSRDVLMSDVWGANWFGSTKTLDVHVASVRRRLSLASAGVSPKPQVPEITTLRGFGYRLETPS